MTLNCEKINLKKGSKGKKVEELQTILKQKGHYTATIDGIFGSKTETAVKKLQKQQGNSQDGVFGPKTCNKLQAQKEPETPSKTSKGRIITVLEKVGKITIKDKNTLYKAFQHIKYQYYNNDIYTLQQELDRVQKGKGLNCTDQAQLYMKAYQEAGFKEPIRIVRGLVTCKSGKAFGHVWCQVYTGGKWVNVDPSAISAHGYGIGKLICTRGYKITNINPAWAVSDDGRT